MRGAYLIALLISSAGLAIIDYRFKLALFSDRKRAVRILLMALPVFIAWDILGILLDIYYIGSNDLLLGIQISQFPVEEIFFLLLLNYSSLVIYRLIKQRTVKS